MKKITKNIIALLLLLAIAAGLAGCSVRPRPARTEAGEILFRSGFSGEPDSLCPYTAANDEAAAVLSLLYDTLFTVDPTTGEIQGSLCREWSVKEGTIQGTWLWKLTLADGVTWHDGEPLTASDVEFTLQSARDFAARFSFPELELVDTTGIAVEDDRHLAFLVWGDAPWLPELLSRVPILPRHVWNELPGMEYGTSGIPRNAALARSSLSAAAADRSSMIGSGPFRWENWEDGVLTLRRNDLYWGAKPAAQVAELHFACPDAAERLLSRELDACWDLSPAGEELLFRQTDASLTQGDAGEEYIFYFNLGDDSSLLASENIRRALDCCLDREAVLSALGGGAPAWGYLPTVSPWYDPGAVSRIREYSVESAAWLLDQAGYLDTDGDGIRNAAQGKQLSFELLCSGASPVWRDAAAVWQERCRLAGVELVIRAVSPEALYRLAGEGEYQILFTSQHAYLDPFYALGAFYGNGGKNAFLTEGSKDRVISLGANFTGFDDGAYDAVYEKVLTLKGDQRRSAVSQAQAMLYDTAAALPVGFSARRQACSSAWYALRPLGGYGVFFHPDVLAGQLTAMKTNGREKKAK